jgi:hypothetical protein
MFVGRASGGTGTEIDSLRGSMHNRTSMSMQFTDGACMESPAGTGKSDFIQGLMGTSHFVMAQQPTRVGLSIVHSECIPLITMSASPRSLRMIRRDLSQPSSRLLSIFSHLSLRKRGTGYPSEADI